MFAKLLFRSPIATIREVACDAGRGGCGELECSDVPTLAIPLRGCYGVERRGHAVVAHGNTAIFFEARAPYRVEHPAEDGDVTLSITCDEAIESDALEGTHPTHAPLNSDVQLRVRLLHKLLRSAHDPLAAEEATLTVVAEVVRANARLSRRREAAVERAKAFLGDRFRERVLLDDVACEAGISPFALSRAFPAATGATVHGYLTALRHSAALDAIANGNADLAAVAVDCGFSHHSHLTKSFHRAFGSTPSALRARLTN